MIPPDLEEMLMAIKIKPRRTTYVEVVSKIEKEEPIDYKAYYHRKTNCYRLKRIEGESNHDYYKRNYEWERSKIKKRIKKIILVSGILICSSYLLMRTYMPKENNIFQKERQAITYPLSIEIESIENHNLQPFYSEKEKFEFIYHLLE